jgi:DNA-binding response OmpR family regulator
MSRVLIVDDDQDSCTTLAELCRHWGHEVASATEGQEALVVCAAFVPDVVLLDLGLPGLDGWSVARRIRAETAERIYIIALSGWTRPSDRARAFLAGVDDFFLKPANLDVLRNLLDVAPARIAARTRRR